MVSDARQREGLRVLDQFVTNEAAKAIAAAVTGPKTVKTYDFEHELTYEARLERLAWLRERSLRRDRRKNSG